MGVFTRFSDIINANINAVLEKAEDPDKIIRLMIQEMEDTLVEIRSSAAKCIADRKETGRHIAYLEREQEEWARRAELAIRRDREDLARSRCPGAGRADDTGARQRRNSQGGTEH